MKNILIISGKKQSGKNSLCAFLTGYMLKKYRKETGLDDYGIHPETGELLVPITEAGSDYSLGKNGEPMKNVGVFDIFRTDPDYQMYAADNIWKYVKPYNFAAPLKGLATEIFGIKHENVWGTDEEKNRFTHIPWDRFKDLAPEKYVGKKGGFITGREFLEIMGTNVFRAIYPDCWVNFCYKQICQSESKLHVIFDARFPNEIDFFKEKAKEDVSINLKVIRLNKRLDLKGKTESDVEMALDGYDRSKYDYICENQNMSIEEKNADVLGKLLEWGMIEVEI